MLKRRLTISEYFLIAVNLVPLWGVWFDNWKPSLVFLVYCLETIIIGIYNVIKLTIASFFSPDQRLNQNQPSGKKGGIFVILFFIVHYGFFVFVQMTIFLSVSSIESTKGDVGAFEFVTHFRKYLNKESLMFLLLLAVSYGLIMIKDFLLSGEYRRIAMAELMFQPYMRIFVQQFTVILGSMMLGFGAGKVFMLVFVAAKIFFEIAVPFDAVLKKQRVKE